MGGGDDPHFSIVLPSSRLLCFTVQGEHGFAFNLINNEHLHMNALFVPDSQRPMWSFMERETRDDQLCWTHCHQGEELIDGTYLDYLIDDVMSTDSFLGF
jgi:hypothetical protein